MNYLKHPLQAQSEYLQELYIATLYTMAKCDGELNDAESDFLIDLSANLGLQVNSEKYIKRIYEDVEGLLSMFITDFQEHALLFNFIVDSLVLGQIDGPINESEIDFISQIAGACHVGDLQFDYLSLFAVVLRQRDEKRFLRLALLRPENIPLNNFLYYCEPYLRSSLVARYVNQTLEIRKPLLAARKSTEILLQRKVDSEEWPIYLSEQVMPLIDEAEEKVDQLGTEVKEMTKNWLEISEEHDDWILQQHLWDISGVVNNLFADICAEKLLGEAMKVKPKNQLQTLLSNLCSIIEYIDNLKYLVNR